ncbi:DUF262 domain-containing protein [Kordiimonas lacus]|uniref:DUF262 domain-containing protein n=1 Tax=Kordiimonas lacus TaxID=637679 RepID=A0A1G7BJI4_9PROT|nr:DUF262 domain-containing protein [Kordiimonas lacus]SDE27271.1 Protein of unknown function [Kordiimonas lacus]
MDIKADVRSIGKLKEFSFLVPDYQREYVWKVEDQVEQFLTDIDNEFDETSSNQQSYFIGSVILVENNGKFDVIDGQQRLTTIVIALCAFRDVFRSIERGPKQEDYFKTIQEWLYAFDMETDSAQFRLELQYEDSKGFLESLILDKTYEDEETTSIIKMRQAFERIRRHIEGHLLTGLDNLTAFVRYFLTKIELVVIKSENLSSALKIFETINQRGAGLNAMDLVKNLLFCQANESDFEKIKTKWKTITSNLQACGEGESPLRFLRYFMMARYHNGILREDEIYKWVISAAGKKVLNYEEKPLQLAAEFEKISKRYSDLVKATTLKADGGDYPAVTRIGLMNKLMSRQHLILLLALPLTATAAQIDYLAEQLESFFFFNNTLGIQAKNNEREFTSWASKFRKVSDQDALTDTVDTTIGQYLGEKVRAFKQVFLNISHWHYNPQYRQRYILGQIENTMRRIAGFPQKGLSFFDTLQIEHVLPQTPKNGIIPDEFADMDEYENALYKLGNVTLLEGPINQAVNHFNDLSNDWFQKKQSEYCKSDVMATALLNDSYSIGKNTQFNAFKEKFEYCFKAWGLAAIEKRQAIMMDLAFETWRINGKRIDGQAE